MNKSESFLHTIKARHIIAPILLGLSVVFFMFKDELQALSASDIEFASHAWIWLLLAACMMLFRDLGYIIRLKILANKKLSWRQCTRIILLWEFASAVTPSAVGGTSVAVFFLYKEKLSFGESSTIVLTTAFLDELYFLITFPILLCMVDSTNLFHIQDHALAISSWNKEFFYLAIVGYSIKALFVSIVAYGLFFNPRAIAIILASIASWKIIKKKRYALLRTAKTIEHASVALRYKDFWFWLKAVCSTIIAWTSRYWVVNFLFLAFFIVPDHLLLFARQFVMWILMLVSPTPGGSGFAEFVFSRFLGEFIPTASLIPIIALLWRSITYYPYLLIGAILLPIWIRKIFTKPAKALSL